MSVRFSIAIADRKFRTSVKTSNTHFTFFHFPGHPSSICIAPTGHFFAQTPQPTGFYTAFYTAQRAIDVYQKECAKWEEAYGEKATPKVESMHEKLQRYQEKADRQNASQPYLNRDKGAR